MDHIVCCVTSEEAGKGVFGTIALGDANGVWNNKCRRLLFDRYNPADWDDEVRYPTKNVRMETNVIFGDVNTTLNKNIPL